MLRYFRETKENYHPNTQFAWDPNIKRGVWLYFDGRFKDHSNYDLATFVNYVRKGTWIETSEHGIITSTPEIVAEQKEKEEREEKAREAEQARVRAEITQREKERQDAESRRLATLNHRNKVNDTLGINIFGRLDVAARLAEQQDWARLHSELTEVLSFVTGALVPTYTYYRNPNPAQCARAWRVNNVTKVVEWRSRSSDWQSDDIERFYQLPSWYTPVQVATEAEALAPTPTYVYYKGTGAGWGGIYWRCHTKNGTLETHGPSDNGWERSMYTVDQIRTLTMKAVEVVSTPYKD